MSAAVDDAQCCQTGDAALRDPLRKKLDLFDIFNQKQVVQMAAHSLERHFGTPVSTAQTIRPAFGGENLTTFYATSARRGPTDIQFEKNDMHGQRLAIPDTGQGLGKLRVIL